MKKIISVLLAIVLCLSSTSVFAAPDIEKLFNAKYTDFEAMSEFSLTLDKPLEMFGALSALIDESIGSDNITFSDIIDLKSLMESIFDSTKKMNLKCDVSTDYKKINIYLSQSSNAPININKSLKITADAKNELWIKLDFSDIDNPVYQIIVSAPSSDRYMVMDYAKFFNDVGEDEALAEISSMFNEEYIKSARKISIDTLKKNADISYKGGYFVIKMDDNQAKNWVIDITYEALRLANIPNVEFTEEQKNQLKLMLNGIQIFGKNGIEIKYKANSKGIISNEESKISFNLNLYDILTLAGVTDIEGITKENSNIAFTIYTKAKYTKVNTGEKVKFPTLTDENTINMLEFANPDYGYIDEEYVSPYEYVYLSTSEPIIENGTAYVPLREFMASLTNEDAYITWDNGTITITSVMKYFKHITFAEGSNSVNKDGTVIILDEPVKVINGRTALSHEFIEKVLNGDFYYISSWYGSGEWVYAIDVANPDYTE